jgi:hypothetical protein
MKKLIGILVVIFVSIQLFSQEKQYKVENFEIVYEMEVMGMKTITNMYVKNFGEVEVSEVKTSVFGNEIHTRSINDGEFIYQIDMIAKTYTKTPIENNNGEESSQVIDYDNLTEEIKEKYKIIELGTEEIVGKPCKMFEMGASDNRMQVWIWKNIVLKTKMSQMGMEVIMTTTKLDISPSFPPDIFMLPADFTMQQNESEE